jgi:hypothetical protein
VSSRTLLTLRPFMCHLCARSWNTQVVCGNILIIERVHRRFVRYALQGLGWTDMHDPPPYVDRCALIRLETPCSRPASSCLMFIFNLLSVSRPEFFEIVVFSQYEHSSIPQPKR